MGKKRNNWPFLDIISSTDFIFGTKVQPKKAHSMTQVMMTLTEYQGKNFPKMGQKLNNPLVDNFWNHLLFNMVIISIKMTITKFRFE